MRQAEEFWEELLAQIEARQVIPVVGAELLSVVDGSREAPLYEVVGAKLLSKYGVDPTSVVRERHHELNDAVCALAARGKRVQDLYRPINELLREATERVSPASMRALRNLAGIPAFNLFVTTTPDDCLAGAIEAERSSGTTERVVFAPKLATGSIVDLPDAPPSRYTAVCYLFGRTSASPFAFAIHDEDTLEFIHTLQMNAAQSLRRLFSEIRQQSLLFVGCNFADWLSRFFIRVANTQRLADNRSKREFLAEETTTRGGSLTLFLERFSPDTWVFDGSATAFVDELARRWRDRHPPSTEIQPIEHAGALRARMDETLFLSYSRDDLPAARRLFAELQEIGADIAWFDKSHLKPGDDWERQIKLAIDHCYLFLPVISTGTESRDEGFFREEWTLASERVRRIQGRPFIVPLVVDKDFDGDASRFSRVPDSFPRRQFGHAPEGALSTDVRSTLTQLIRDRRAQRSA